MSYQGGNMGVAAGVSLVFVATIPRIFLTTLASRLVDDAQIAWLSVLISSIATLFMIRLLLYVLSRTGGDLIDATRRLLGNTAAWLVALFYIALFFGNTVLLLREFAENTLLTALPLAEFSLVTIWYIAWVTVFISFGIEVMGRVSYMVLPFLVAFMLLVVIFLIPFYNINQLVPWQGHGLTLAVYHGFSWAGINIGAVLLAVYAREFQTSKTATQALIFGVGGALFMKVVYSQSYLMVFGVNVGQEKILPFFEMARLVYLNRYLQRIEALLIALWGMVSMLALAVSLYTAVYLIARILNLPSGRPIIPLMAGIAANIAMLPPDIITVLGYEKIYHFTSSVGIYGVPLLLFIAFCFKRKEVKRCNTV
ncbi:GerAB/ArcD/ProY family transporter [Sporomusa acidovorans]|uniref:Spore germination protein n=1 Tax=Sporomusa acidovorans (strain ATCC 49682 / DSM 3132 / Mol) TaxID=1123286 RepID=A0ABZ3J675_SPOA4|nr:GerAB/ArcD/ProY family transporter [Sporomusa acidovorans]OZC15410.1 spore germination protein [Sporomusa acidovorans DSM 3132]SDF13152.1 spore germination protein (amino acid permease) [Sporomusa acidovorans]